MSQPAQFLCHCGATLMAPPGAPSVQCPACRAVVAVPPGATAGPPMSAKSNTWMVVLLALAAIGAVVAVVVLAGGEDRYVKKSKTSESRQFVKKIYDGARAYYRDVGYSGGGLTPVPPQFPGPSTSLTPMDPTSCCEKCAPDSSLWIDDVWVALQFSVDDPSYYSYQYIVAPDGRSFTARAMGDLDCDGEYSTFEMYGTVLEDGSVPGNAEIYRQNELE